MEQWPIGSVAKPDYLEAQQEENRRVLRIMQSMNTISTEAIEKCVKIRNNIANQLSSAMAAKTDGILREAVRQFLGNDDLTLDELTRRCQIQHFENGIDVFYFDGVALVELFPITVQEERKLGTATLYAKRQFRFLQSI